MKDIKCYEGLYAITEDGKVYSYRSKKYLSPYKNKGGYLIATLSKQNIKEHFLIHRLVAEAYIPNPNNYPQVNHKDEDKTNNHFSNLEWITAKDNINYGNHNSKVIETQSYNVFCVELNKEYLNARIAAEELALNRQNIQACCNGKRKTCGGYHWRYV